VIDDSGLLSGMARLLADAAFERKPAKAGAGVS
jgi:hypothetical protein